MERRSSLPRIFLDEGQGREPTKAIVIITVWEQSLKSYIEAKRDVVVKRPEKCKRQTIPTWLNPLRL